MRAKIVLDDTVYIIVDTSKKKIIGHAYSVDDALAWCKSHGYLDVDVNELY